MTLIILHPEQFKAFKKAGWVEVGEDGKLRFKADAPMFQGKPIHVLN